MLLVLWVRPFLGHRTRELKSCARQQQRLWILCLLPTTKTKISLSLVPYASQVHLGEDLFNAMGIPRLHYFSECVTMPESAYESAAWDTSLTYQQGQHFRKWSSWNYNCRFEDYMQVIPLSQDTVELNAAIADLEPSGATSIFYGLKWGAALLDPSIRPLLDNMPNGSIDPAFSDRPFDYENTGINSTKKYIVVMTDGQNFGVEELQADKYDTPSEIAHWAQFSFGDQWSWTRMARNEGYSSYESDYITDAYTSTGADGYMDSICTAAKSAGIEIYGIAMGAPEHGQTEMAKCASSPGHYFETSGQELVDIFEAIASQITDLRLTL